jgi:hypothetical protein
LLGAEGVWGEEKVMVRRRVELGLVLVLVDDDVVGEKGVSLAYAEYRSNML